MALGMHSMVPVGMATVIWRCCDMAEIPMAEDWGSVEDEI